VSTSADLALTKSDAPDPILAGNNITYTLTATNNGPSDATSISFSDAVPANTTFVSFAAPAGWTATTPAVGATGTVTSTSSLMTPGASAVFTLVVQVNAGAAVGSVITNTATISSGTADPNAANNSATATTTIASNVSDLAITKTVSPVTPAYPANTTVTFTINVANAGPNSASSVSVTDTLPATITYVSATSSQGTCSGTTTITCAVGTLANGGTASITIVGTTTGTGTSTNTATVTSASADPNAANNTASVTLTLVGDIPTLSPLMLALLALTLLGAGWFMMKR